MSKQRHWIYRRDGGEGLRHPIEGNDKRVLGRLEAGRLAEWPRRSPRNSRLTRVLRAEIIVSKALMRTSLVIVAAVLLFGSADQAMAARSCGTTRATIVGTAGNDVIVGTSRPDVITGRGGNDTIWGLEGSDLICGGDGADVVFTGPGRRGNHVAAGAGRDVIHGGPDGDVLIDGRGADRVFAGPGDDVVGGRGRFSPGNDMYSMGRGADDAFDGPGNDVYRGRAGRDRFGFGDEGEDVFIGGPGENDGLLWLGPDSGVVIDLASGLIVAPGQPIDSVGSVENAFGSGGSDTLIGNAAANELTGDSGDDHLEGGTGDDFLLGDAGTDFLDGGDGQDWLNGDAGTDTCVNGETVVNCEL
jgi:Ca2+-binding RTX toxin-like protein